MAWGAAASAVVESKPRTADDPNSPKVRHLPAFLGATVDFSYDRAPIYIQLATLFRRLVVTGQWPVGQRIPTHEQLALQLNVNPATIAKAVSLLAEEGLLKRSRRSGTSVIAKPAVTQTFRVGTTWRELLNNFETLEFELLTLRKDAELAKPLHAHTGREERYDFLHSLYRSEGRPVLAEEAYIGQSVVRGAGATARKTPPLKLLDQSSMSITRADETVRFGTADSQISELLQTPLNAPIAIVYHTVLGARGRLLYHARSFVRGDLVAINEPIKFSRKDQSAIPA
jgi:GntR family transcriptional regulator